MNTEILYCESNVSASNQTINNNPPLPIKKWSTSSMPGLGSVDESIESILTEQTIENIERKLGEEDIITRKSSFGSEPECRSRNSSLGDIHEEDNDTFQEIAKNNRYHSRHHSIVGIVKGFSSRSEKRNTDRRPSLDDKRTGRRKSIKQILTQIPKGKLEKLEKKRRPGVVEVDNENAEPDDMLPPSGYDRRKRRSWWNIFVPEEQNGGRRSSTDVGRTQLQLPYTRTKSHSVDHGISAPFDVNRLISKDRRFNSLGDSDSEIEKKKVIPPINTVPYTVKQSDTLNSVAARFDITPSELRKLNRLASNLIFPGQLLHVPEKKTSEEGNDPTNSSLSASEDGENEGPAEERELLDTLRPVSPKPGYTTQRFAPRRTDLREARFLKINVRHITDGQGVVAGVLLVTPNAVMFDPNVSDPLVIEHGPESYGVIAPMEFVVNAAIYYDIAHMRVGHTDNKSDTKPEIYHAKPPSEREKPSEEQANSPGRDSLLVKDETFPELAPKGSSDDENESLSSYRDGCAFPKAFDRDLVTPTNTNNETTPTNTTCSSLTEQQSSPCEGTRRLEERRASSLDQHWPAPKSKQNSESFDSQTDSEKIQLGESARGVEDGLADKDGDNNNLTKSSYHDSGIDITEVPVIQPTVKASSDADIILSSNTDCVLLVNQPQVEPKKKTSSVSFSLEEEQHKSQVSSEDEGKKASKKTKRMSYPLASWMEGTFVNDSKDEKESLPSLPTSADSQHSSMFSKVFSRRSSIGTFIRTDTQSKHPMPKLDYRSMVSVEDMPNLFFSVDKLIPRPAINFEDPPLYLRLRMGKPLNKKIPKSTPIMSYGKKKMRPEYWFSVPRNRVDDLYSFLQLWVPLLYGELDETDVKLRGYELVESDTELWDDEAGEFGEFHTESGEGDSELGDITRESWEVLSMSEELRRALYASSVGSLDMEMFVPDLVGVTEILTEEHRKQLCRHLPARAEGYLWTLVFSTSQHGFSLNSMYRKMVKMDSPILLVIEDTDHNVFGALTSCSLKVSDHFYGTGESLLFTFSPEFTAYQWTGENMYFIKGNNESLSIGAGDGKFGLWLDGDLYQGRSERCGTYGNEPLATQEDFVVKTLECWAFI